MTDAAPPILELRSVSRRFGSVDALQDVSLTIPPAAVTCLLGDNGAGKSTLIRILSGVHPPTTGTMLVDGAVVRLGSPREAMAHGIATVYQDLAVVPLMSLWRNFFLGAEPRRGCGPLGSLDVDACRRIAAEELARMGIAIDDVEQPVGTLSGGERQSLAIARSLYFGARVLILDEPTAALGIRQTELVLRQIRAARERGVAIVFITHNPLHAAAVGDRFVVLRHGHVVDSHERGAFPVERLADLMSGATLPG
jgi:simple sugar transport system ATP-binding protein